MVSSLEHFLSSLRVRPRRRVRRRDRRVLPLMQRIVRLVRVRHRGTTRATRRRRIRAGSRLCGPVRRLSKLFEVPRRRHRRRRVVSRARSRPRATRKRFEHHRRAALPRAHVLHARRCRLRWRRRPRLRPPPVFFSPRPPPARRATRILRRAREGDVRGRVRRGCSRGIARSMWKFAGSSAFVDARWRGRRDGRDLLRAFVGRVRGHRRAALAVRGPVVLLLGARCLAREHRGPGFWFRASEGEAARALAVFREEGDAVRRGLVDASAVHLGAKLGEVAETRGAVGTDRDLGVDTADGGVVGDDHRAFLASDGVPASRGGGGDRVSGDPTGEGGVPTPGNRGANPEHEGTRTSLRGPGSTYVPPDRRHPRDRDGKTSSRPPTRRATAPRARI